MNGARVRKPRRWNGWRCMGCNHVHQTVDPHVPPSRCENGCRGRGWHRRADVVRGRAPGRENPTLSRAVDITSERHRLFVRKLRSID